MAYVPLHASIPESRLRAIPWNLALAAGRLIEIGGAEDTAALTLSVGLILDAQRGGEQAAWVGPEESSFYVPDIVESGIDLNALVVVRVVDSASGARAADKLIRSGSFGIVVVDAGPDPRIPTPLLARLASLAQRNHTAVVFLTHQRGSSSLGSLISLRVRARRQRIATDRFRCWLEVLKDKRRGPTWGHDEVCRGAPGMR